jgi:hypothetical protein
MAWLSHEGEVISCKLFGHIEKLGELPLFRDAYATYKEACAGNEAWMQDELSKLGPDDWLEMHRFEGMNDGAKSDFVRTVYEAGWIRLGRSFERPAPPVERRFDRRRPTFGSEAPLRWYLEAEGLTEAVRTQRDTLKEPGLRPRLPWDEVPTGQLRDGVQSQRARDARGRYPGAVCRAKDGSLTGGGFRPAPPASCLTRAVQCRLHHRDRVGAGSPRRRFARSRSRATPGVGFRCG